jgi:phosphoglycolate phosphatase
VKDVRLLVFDLDGTLVDSIRDLTTATNAALGVLAPGTPAIPLEVVRSFIGDGARVLLRRSLEHAHLPHTVDEAMPVYLDCYSRSLLDSTRLYPGVREALDRLHGRTLAVLTNKPGGLSRTILAGLGVADRFARIWGAGDVPGHKPEPAGLLRLLAELETAPGEALMVGDSAVDVKTGRAAGVRTVGVTWGFKPQDLELEPPDLLIDDMRELPTLLSTAA